MKLKLSLIITVVILTVIFSCKKQPEIPGNNRITIGQTTIDSLSYFNAQISTVISDLGSNAIIQYGHCWSNKKEPTIEDFKSENRELPQPKKIESKVTDLFENTTYYVRSYLSTNATTIYGNESSFTTLETGIPRLTTNEVSNITLYSAECSGNVSVDSGLFITRRGFCWDTDSIFTIDSCIDTLVAGDSLGSFFGVLDNLDEGIKYYAKAYAINDKGVGYGNIVSFSTIAITLPEVTTTQISEIGAVSAYSGGNVASNGNGIVFIRGICWNTEGNPTLENNNGITEDGSGVGEYISHISGLSVNTDYYVRAYATNEKGTSYGGQYLFKTLEAIPCGEQIIIYKEQTYHTVKIGDQCWMKENLNIGTRINSSQEMTDNFLIEKYCYDDLDANCDLFGGLYQWDEIMQYTTSHGSQGICPTEWHVPTLEEWRTLEGNVDSEYGVGDNEWTLLGWRGFDVGKNLKSSGGWINNNNGTDLFGFTAFPGGRSSDLNGSFFDKYNGGFFWSSSSNLEYGISFQLSSNSDKALLQDIDKLWGLSIRCIKN